MYFVFFKIIPGLGGHTYSEDYPIGFFLGYEISFFTIVGAAGTSSFFNRYGLYKLKQQTEKEKSLLIKELNFLKNQFNSHITFNFLNYCYSNIHKQSPETAEAISNFSDMLRYTLQTGPEEKVALSKEIIYIENFISLQKLLSAKVFVNFDYDGNIGETLILPRILVTFVENAFKHGLCNDPKFPIQINLMVNDDKLTFTIKNKINHSKRIDNTNKGMENVTQILDLYYTDNYELRSNAEGEFFCVDLWMGLMEQPQCIEKAYSGN
jgi:sensor histidine kinase YesM